MATPPGVPHTVTRASIESGISGFSTLRINHYATRGGAGQALFALSAPLHERGGHRVTRRPRCTECCPNGSGGPEG